MDVFNKLQDVIEILLFLTQQFSPYSHISISSNIYTECQTWKEVSLMHEHKIIKVLFLQQGRAFLDKGSSLLARYRILQVPTGDFLLLVYER